MAGDGVHFSLCHQNIGIFEMMFECVAAIDAFATIVIKMYEMLTVQLKNHPHKQLFDENNGGPMNDACRIKQFVMPQSCKANHVSTAPMNSLNVYSHRVKDGAYLAIRDSLETPSEYSGV